MFYWTSRKDYLLFFLGILISKEIGPASFFSFQLRMKTSIHKNINGRFCISFKEVKCKVYTQITHLEEIKKPHRVIRSHLKKSQKLDVLHGRSLYKITKATLSCNMEFSVGNRKPRPSEVKSFHETQKISV